MSGSNRRLVSALALMLFSLRVLAPEVGHACGAMPDHACPADEPSAGHAPAEHAPAEHGTAHHGAAVAADAGDHHHAVPAASKTITGTVSPGPSAPHDSPHDAPHDAPCDCSDWCCCLPTLTSPPLPTVAVLVAAIVDRATPMPWPPTLVADHRADRLHDGAGQDRSPGLPAVAHRFDVAHVAAFRRSVAAPVMRQADSTYVAATTTPPVARAIISGSMSRYCPGLTLETCPSPSADSLRRVIIARVTHGDPRERIEADPEREFGASIRSTPKAAGFGLVGWSVPGLVMLVAAVVQTGWIRRRVVVA